jgi:adenosylmethionine-8-amino-7-oxononanoate aminotransferase
MYDSIRIPTPYCYRCPLGLRKDDCGCKCADLLKETLERYSGETAAIILEPILLGAGGMIVYPAEYLKRAGELAKSYGVHLILDEVATGFGRTGKMFAADHAGITPDFMCISKGLTGGTLPLAATLTTEEVFDSFAEPVRGIKTFYHGHTFTANPVACAAANASLELFETENTLANVAYLQNRLLDDFASYADHPLVGDIRIIGCCGALELVKNKESKEPLSIRDMTKIGFYGLGFDQGIILRPVANVVYLFLPLAVGESDLGEMLNRFRLTLTCVTDENIL